jgi:predicted nucleotidyltransferase
VETNLSVPTIDIRKRISEKTIRSLVGMIAEKFQPQKIILFGSYARGSVLPESDIDLLIIMETPLRPVQQALKIRQFINPLFGLDLIIYTPQQLQQRLVMGDSFLRDILAEGLVLYESPDA